MSGQSGYGGSNAGWGSALQDVGQAGMSSGNPWGMAAGAAVGALGGILSANQGVDRRTVRRRGRASITREKARQEGLFDLQENFLQNALQSMQGGYQNALAGANRQARASSQQVRDREMGMLGQMQSDMASRGLGNTTAFANARRGLAADTSRRLQEIDQGLAQLTSGLQVGLGQAQAQGQNALAGLAQQRSSFSERMFEGLFGLNTMS